LNAGADARCTAKLKRQVRKRFPCGIWRMNTVEWSGVNKEVPSRDFTMQEIELHSSHENWYLSTRPFSENKAKRPPGRSRRTQSQGDIGGIQVLPQEILIQIIRNLVPTGGIFHCAFTTEQTWQVSEGKLYELNRSKQTTNSGSYVKQRFHIIRHITTYKPTQHRFFPDTNAREYKHVTALSSACSRLNEAWNFVLYGENLWLLDLNTRSREHAKILIDQSFMRDAERDQAWPKGMFSFPYAPKCYTAVRPSVQTDSTTTPSATAWPLSQRTAPYVRDLAISGTTGAHLNIYGHLHPDYSEDEHTIALAARLEAIVNTFLGDPDGENSQGNHQHSLRRLVVQLADEQNGANWKLEEGIEQSSPIHDDLEEKCRRLSLRPDMPADARSHLYPAAKTLWTPFRRFKGVREVELAGLLTSTAAKALSSSMTSASGFDSHR
jgi:hypothetical protein